MKDQLALSFVLCDSSGNQVSEVGEAFSRKISFKRNLPGTATIVLDIESPLASYCDPTILPRLKVYRDTTAAERAVTPSVLHKLVFYGYLPSENVQDDTSTGQTTATFADPRNKFAQYYLTTQQVFTHQFQGDILWGLIANIDGLSGGDVMLDEGMSDSSVFRDRTYDVGANIADAVSQMTQVINGPDVYVIPDDSGPTFLGIFTSESRQGADKAGVIFYHGPSLPTNCDVQRTYTKTITYATENGVDPTGVAQSENAGSPGSSPYGLLMAFTTESDPMDAATLTSKAQGTVDQFENPQAVWQVKNITQDAPQAFIEFDLGDTIRLVANRGKVVANSVTLRVDGYDLSVSDDGTVNVTSLILVDP